MKIHEYQAKQLLRDAGVAVLEGLVARSPDEASKAFAQLGGPLAVVKAQIHAGGRGKGTVKSDSDQRGVQLVRSADEAAQVAKNLLGEELVTIQTGPAGKTVNQVFVEAGCDIARELYLGIVVDRAGGLPVLMVSSEGGMDIEEVAANTPELIFKEPFHPDGGLQSYQVRKLCHRLGVSGPSIRSAEKFMRGLCKLFVELDCSLVEINPLVVTKAGELVALDAKMSFDDNASFRHPQLAELRDLSEEDSAEVRAGEAGLSYVQLEGNIGCLVNGAGLAMSTMDLIKLHGGEPANFLDVGGGAKVNHDLTNEWYAHGVVFTRGRGVDLCMDHHRAAPYATLWTELDLGAGERPWRSGGRGDRGPHTAAYDTLWNLTAATALDLPRADYGPRMTFVGFDTNDTVPGDADDWYLEDVAAADIEPANLWEAMVERRLGATPDTDAGAPDTDAGEVAPGTDAGVSGEDAGRNPDVDAGGPSAPDDDGCGCHAVGAPGGRAPGGWVLVLALALVWTRRRGTKCPR